MTQVTIAASKALIAFMLVGAVFVQAVILPVLAGQMAEIYPEVEYLRIPFTVVAVLVVVSAEVVLLCLWTLLSMVRKGSLFSRSAFTYVNLIIGALLVAAALSAGVIVVLLVVVQAGPPGVIYPLFAGVAGCAALALVVLVMRGLLKKASQQESFLAEVI